MRTILDLKKTLGIPDVNTGAQWSHNGQACGVIFDDVEGLYAELTSDHKISLRSGLELSPYLYRGQTKDYGKCCPGLARFDSIPNLFLGVCRRIAFESAVGQHPFVQYTESAIIGDLRLNVDYSVIAQHYGFATDLLDVTASFDVACFFATHSHDASTGKWVPANEACGQGVLYLLNSLTAVHSLLHSSGDGRILEAGWQPLPRPDEQRALAVKLKNGQDLTSIPGVSVYVFDHCERVSKQIGDQFEEGRLIFPRDSALEVSEKFRGSFQFSFGEIEAAWRLTEVWLGRSFNTDERRNTLIDAGISVSNEFPVHWEVASPEFSPHTMHNRLGEVIQRVRTRYAVYGTDNFAG